MKHDTTATWHYFSWKHFSRKFIIICYMLMAALVPTAVTAEAYAQLPAADEEHKNEPTDTSENVRFLAHIGGTTNAVAIAGNYLYIGEGPQLAIYDITTPNQPTLVGRSELLSGAIKGLVVTNHMAYLALDVYGFYLVDVTDPASPVLQSRYPGADAVLDIAVVGETAYIATGQAGLHIVDVSNPTAPTRVGLYEIVGSINKVRVVNQTAYVATDTQGLRVVNVANGASPTESGAYTADVIVDLDVHEGRLYAATASNGMRILDISNAGNLTIIGTYNGPIGTALATVFVSGSTAYLIAAIDQNYELWTINITNQTVPLLLDSFPLVSQGYAMQIQGGVIYVANGNGGLRLVNGSNSNNLQPLDFNAPPGFVGEVVVASGSAYVADWTNRLHAIDVGTTGSLEPRAHIDLLWQPEQVTVKAGIAFIVENNKSANQSALNVIRFTAGDSPAMIGRLPLTGCCVNDLFLAGATIYLARDGGIVAVSVIDPTTPTQLRSYDLPGAINGIYVDGTTAYVANGTFGLRLLDLAGSTITEISTFNTPGVANAVYVANLTAYVADGTEGLRLIRVVNKNIPSESGFYDTPGRAVGVHVIDKIAYVADGSSGTRIIDTTSLSAPKEVGFYDTSGSTVNVFADGNKLYAADRAGGLYQLQYPICYPLVPLHTGSGANPQLTPTKSAGCDEGEYVFGEQVSVQARPDDGWRVTSWVGTNSDNSLSSNNIVTMPAAGHEVIVNYGRTCYLLTLLHNGSGTRPTATPANSVGCAVGEYTAGESIALRANPGQGYTVGQWQGTENDGSTLDVNSVLMPPNNSTVTIMYVQACYQLTRTHSGSGTDPTAAPPNSVDCAIDQYYFGASVTLNATPADGWEVGGWGGTNDNSNTTLVNVVTMPASPHTVSANYNQIPIAGEGDPFEEDDSCAQSRPIATDGRESQNHTFHAVGDIDWVRFNVTEGETYRVDVLVDADSQADVNMEVYAKCEDAQIDNWSKSFSPSVRLDITGPASGQVYLRLANQDANLAGEHVRYTLSVRQIEENPDNRALILVAGRLDGTDSLQNNIHHVTNKVYEIFQSNGYDPDDITYLATDSNLPGYTAALTKSSLRTAITEWAKGKVGSDGVLTLYLMDHGSSETFYLDEVSGQRLSPTELDAWLSVVEADAPNVKINVIIEACQSGSFITRPNSIAKAGRIVITSTDTVNDAKASTEGAYFSDHFLTALHQGFNLSVAFSEAKSVAATAFALQTAQLDADGDGIANEFDDALTAAGRSFAYKGTFDSDPWPPHIFSATGPNAINGTEGVITVDVRDNIGVRQVIGIVYEPDYAPPAVGEQLQPELLPNFLLRETTVENQFQGRFTGFTQDGTYRIVIYADDAAGLKAHPATVTVTKVASTSPGTKILLPIIYAAATQVTAITEAK